MIVSTLFDKTRYAILLGRNFICFLSYKSVSFFPVDPVFFFFKTDIPQLETVISKTYLWMIALKKKNLHLKVSGLEA